MAKNLKQIISGISNVDFWNECRRMSPTFASHTSEATADFFNERSFEALLIDDVKVLNEFFQLSMRIVFQMFNVSKAKDPLKKTGLIETYETREGGYLQRISIDTIKPTSPRYRGLKDGDSVDMQSVRIPKTQERLFEFNTDYQSFISLQQFQAKTLFTREYGVGQYFSGIMTGLKNGYTIQRYEWGKSVINGIFHSEKWPLRPTQVYRVANWNSEPTEAQLKEVLLAAMDFASSLESCSQTDAYNSYGFSSSPDVSDFVMIVRAGLKNRIKMNVEAGTYHPDKLTLPFEVFELDDFGGLVPYTINASTGALETELQPIYDKNGESVAYVDASVTVNGPARFNGTKWIVNVTSGGVTADTNQTFVKSEIGWLDPNADVLGFIAERGIIFEGIQNPYTVTPAYPNPAGLYTTFWANSPNNMLTADPLYNLFLICKPESQESQSSQGDNSDPTNDQGDSQTSGQNESHDDPTVNPEGPNSEEEHP